MKIAFKFTFMILVLGLALTSCKKKAAGDKAKTGEATGEKATAANSVSYAIDAAVSKIYWTGTKPTGSHTGTINIAKGKLDAVGSDISGGQFMIDMNTITNTDMAAGDGKEDLEAHLKGTAEEKADHFFNVAKYPDATFVISKVEKAATGGVATHNITGDLTLKGKTKSITFPASVVIAGDKINATAPAFTINRTEWGVNYGSKSIFDDLKDKYINDDISLNIEMQANKM